MNADVLKEMVARYLLGVRPAAPWGIPAGCLAIAFLLAQLGQLPVRWRAPVRWLLALVIAAGALYWGWQLRWIGDDAFISFRYAENLARGDGLVFNVGERVEGYTNFLWTMVISAGIAVGIDPVQASVVLGFASYAALIALTTRVARQTAPPGVDVVISVAALVCAAQYLLASFATSGLETMLGSALVLGALERAISGKPATAGLLGVFAAMTHPDHAVFYAALAGALVLAPETRRDVVRYLAPFALVFLPYFIWRWSYYGDLFPNTYYAKSAGLAYYRQGAIYVCATLIGTGLWAVLPLAGFGLWCARKSLFGRFCAIAIPVFTLYVMKIGGDFMYGRLFCPLIAPVLLLSERGLRELLSKQAWLRSALALVLVCVAALPVRLFQPFEKHWHLADERTFYALRTFAPVQVDSLYFGWSKTLQRIFPRHSKRPRIALMSVGIISYYTGLPVLDGFGLTDRHVARRPVGDRGRPGHEKMASPAHIVEGDADVSETSIYPPPYNDISRINLSGLRFFVVRYDASVLERLHHKHGSVRVPDVPGWIERVAHTTVIAGRDDAACDAWFADEIYFSKQRNHPERAVFQQRLLDSGRPPGLRSTDPALYDFRRTHRPDPRTAFHFDPAELVRWHGGKALREGFGMATPLEPQGETKNQSGTMLDTFTPSQRDRASGTMRSDPFPLVGDVMEVRIAGGRRNDKLHVALLVNDTVVLASGGCETEMIGSRLWQIAPYKGQQGVLEIMDRDKGGWGHLIVDDVVQWVPKTP